MAARTISAPARLLLAVLILIVGACTPGATATPSATTLAPTAPPTAAPTPTAAPAFPVTLNDDEGTEVTIPAEPQKIVSLTPDTTETLFAIGAGSRVVAKVEDVANYPPEAASVPSPTTQPPTRRPCSGTRTTVPTRTRSASSGGTR